ncbi:MAG TPA: hypothetical protein VFE58_12050 [Tepidisphaeraceae bacterium]|jgi:hypothetical protein|nr:hypothetical protein [Tepidisphaeraceae bacterium]
MKTLQEPDEMRGRMVFGKEIIIGTTETGIFVDDGEKSIIGHCHGRVREDKCVNKERDTRREECEPDNMLISGLCR